MQVVEFGYEKIRLLLQQQRFELALKEILEQLNAEPDEALLHAYSGYCYLKLNRFEDGLVAVKKSIALEPDLAYAHSLLSNFYEKINRNAEAEAAIREALQLDWYNPDYYYFLGRILLYQNRVTEALDAANSGLSIFSEHVNCNNLKGICLVCLGNEEGLCFFQVSLTIDPEYSYTFTNYGIALLKLGKPTEAIKIFKEALRINPDSEIARLYLLNTIKLKNPVYYFLKKVIGQKKPLQVAVWVLTILVVFIAYNCSIFIFLSLLVLSLIIVFYEVFANTLTRLNRPYRHVLSKHEIQQSNLLLMVIKILMMGLIYNELYFFLQPVLNK
ncbi:MAG: tetratricopeptide repeat protein [Hymenobacteraceae bacterium]|nr:tetratricopeptide repeat protein [Hymenobacteraceae bacterium]MDX5396761.1 tetratricopeptide repeat protein [Hymenobacteraceae bacterium]MDX5443137.1 tetratricopeptide repeat protein [Hymenobacteraceae bacterium]MDX5512823.1 tetratricopeptide repeat protein [Hymenobacteraceae bacterium]